MGPEIEPPAEVVGLAQRRTWFDPDGAELLLQWMERSGVRFLGMDVADKSDEGAWTLLIDPILDLSDQAENATAIEIGREFISERRRANRMFDVVWEGRAK